MSATFRFDAAQHEYIDDHGVVLPHITGMLEQVGWIDDRWFTEESSERGTAVHRLTAEHDLGAIDVATCVSKYRGWLLSHIAASYMIRPTWATVEEPVVHDQYRFGGRPDRTGVIFNAKGVLEIKSGAKARSHEIQTALQAVLVSPSMGLPAEHLQRFALYLKDSGKFELVQHRRRDDFDEAYRIIRRCAR